MGCFRRLNLGVASLNRFGDPLSVSLPLLGGPPNPSSSRSISSSDDPALPNEERRLFGRLLCEPLLDGRLYGGGVLAGCVGGVGGVGGRTLGLSGISRGDI